MRCQSRAWDIRSSFYFTTLAVCWSVSDLPAQPKEVDGKTRTDMFYPAGFMDVVQIEKTKDEDMAEPISPFYLSSSSPHQPENSEFGSTGSIPKDASRQSDSYAGFLVHCLLLWKLLVTNT